MVQPAHVGIDVGGTKVLGIVCDVETGDVHAQRRQPTPSDPMELPNVISSVVDELVNDMGRVDSIGVGLPGLVDKAGMLHYGPNVPGVLSLNMATRLRKQFEVPAAGHNDGTCAAVAEHKLGAARGYSDVAMITQGTGIGGGLIINDQVVSGANGFAGEPGHVLIDHGGSICKCGIKGCWEAYSSGTGLATLAKNHVSEFGANRILELAGGVVEHIRGEHVSAALDEGDEDAQEVLRRFVSWTSAGIAGLISLLDPGVVVLGGGLSTLATTFVADIQEQVPSLLMGSSYRPTTPIVAAEMGPESGAIGAAINGYRTYLEELDG